MRTESRSSPQATAQATAQTTPDPTSPAPKNTPSKMRFTIIVPFVLATVEAAFSHANAIKSSKLYPRQTILVCDDVYGEGFVKCGGPESEFCYNPDLGQV